MGNFSRLIDSFPSKYRSIGTLKPQENSDLAFGDGFLVFTEVIIQYRCHAFVLEGVEKPFGIETINTAALCIIQPSSTECVSRRARSEASGSMSAISPYTPKTTTGSTLGLCTDITTATDVQGQVSRVTAVWDLAKKASTGSAGE